MPTLTLLEALELTKFHAVSKMLSPETPPLAHRGEISLTRRVQPYRAG